MLQSKYRYLVPNAVTFISMSCGIISIMCAATGRIASAGVLILASYVLDLLDGMLARKLNASSEFGLQLDSLVDMVSLGTAPAILAFMHLQGEGITGWYVWPIIILFALAGAFRLARFNLLPPKTTGNKDSAGLTITSAGAVVALAVLSDVVTPVFNLPDFYMLPFLLFISFLMASTIPFPSFYWVFSGRRKSLVLISLFGVSIWVTSSFFTAWFFWKSTYLGVSLARASYKSWK